MNSRINEVRNLRKIAGLLKEDEDFDLEFNPLSQDRIKPQWMSRLNPELNGIEIYNDEENRLFVIFDKDSGQLHIINDWHGEDFDEVWGSNGDIRPDLLAQIQK